MLRYRRTPVRPACRSLATVAALSVAACGGEGSGAGEGGGPLSLGEPTDVFPEDFGTIQTVRELADGTLLVADPLGNALYHVDMTAGTRTTVGARGEGPGEFGQPDAVWPLPGGASLVVDLGNARTVVMGQDLSFGETGPLALGEPRPGSAFVIMLPQGVDGAGRVYTRQMGGFGGVLPDSAAILRVDLKTLAVDTVGSFKLQDRTQTRSGGPDDQNVMVSPVPLSPEDAWGVAPDGSVVLARTADYSVEWISPNGSAIRGPATPYDPVAIGTAEKEEYVAGQGRTGGGIRIGVTIDNGAMQMQMGRGGGGPGSRPRDIDNYTWPETKPPFYAGRLPIDPEGRVWVRRHLEAGADATYDVFGRDGVRVGTVVLEGDRSVVGFGAGAVYAVSFDEFDLTYLERYTLPSL